MARYIFGFLDKDTRFRGPAATSKCEGMRRQVIALHAGTCETRFAALEDVDCTFGGSTAQVDAGCEGDPVYLCVNVLLLVCEPSGAPQTFEGPFKLAHPGLCNRAHLECMRQNHSSL